MLGLGASPAELFVVYDDLDLPLGAKRIRPHGSAGTHNGMRSIVKQLATDRFPRLRVGIGPAGTDAARHVLERFHPKEQVEIESAANIVMPLPTLLRQSNRRDGKSLDCGARASSRKKPTRPASPSPSSNEERTGSIETPALAISRSIVMSHGGRITAENNPDRGVTLRCRFPISHAGGPGESMRMR